jgi:outer membrane protein assembly factor BamB
MSRHRVAGHVPAEARASRRIACRGPPIHNRLVWELATGSGDAVRRMRTGGRMANGLVIDLGQNLSSVDVDRPLPRRPLRALAVALVLIVALAGDAGPVAPAFVLLATVPVSGAAEVALGSDRVFVADPADSVVGGQTWHGEVLAYPLPGRSASWRTRVPQVPEQLSFVPGAGVVLAITPEGVAGAAQTVALDADTGRLLWWSATADFEHAPAGGTGGLLLDGAALGAVLRWTDLRTGRTVWSRAVPAGGSANLLYGASLTDPVWVVVESADGVELVAEKTGAVIANSELAAIRPSGTSGGQQTPGEVDVVGDRVLVLRLAGQGASTLTAFDLATFTRQWTLSGGRVGYPNACGPLICLDGDRGVAGVDPAAGTVVWHTSGWQSDQMVDADHLLARGGQGGTKMEVLDVRTGRVVMRMTGWTPVRDPLIGLSRLVVRPDPGQPESGWFAMIDPRYGAPVPLGELRGVTVQNCQTTADLLTCLTVHDAVQVWRLRT